MIASVSSSHAKSMAANASCENFRKESASMKAIIAPSDAHNANTAVVKSETSHHFCRAASSRWITLSAAGDIERTFPSQ